eukprot:scaffold472_cov109-Isochrysis_galbana.AAC.6
MAHANGGTGRTPGVQPVLLRRSDLVSGAEVASFKLELERRHVALLGRRADAGPMVPGGLGRLVRIRAARVVLYPQVRERRLALERCGHLGLQQGRRRMTPVVDGVIARMSAEGSEPHLRRGRQRKASAGRHRGGRDQDGRFLGKGCGTSPKAIRARVCDGP